MTTRDEFFYLHAGETYGPFSAVELQQAVAAGRLDAEDLVWRAGCEDRVRAGRVKGLFAPPPNGCDEWSREEFAPPAVPPARSPASSVAGPPVDGFVPPPVPETGRSGRSDTPLSGAWNTARTAEWGFRVAQTISDRAARFAEVLAAAFQQRSLRVLWADRQARIVMIGGGAAGLLAALLMLGLVVGSAAARRPRNMDGLGEHPSIAQWMQQSQEYEERFRAEQQQQLDRREQQRLREEQDRLKQQEAQRQRIMTLVRQGDELRAKGRLQESLHRYQQAFEIDPDSALAYQGRGMMSMVLGQWQDAIRAFDEALRRDRQNADILAHRARCYVMLGDYQRAITDLDQAVRLDPSVPDYYSLRGMAFWARNDPKTALQNATSAIQLNEQLAEPLLVRGLVKAAQKDLTGALADLTRAVSLDPRFAQAYYHRGMLHAQRGEQQAAISDYNRALSLDPSQTDGYYHRALLLAAAGDDQGAVRDLSEFLGRQGNHLRAHFLRGESYIALEQHRLALDDFTRVIQLDGNNAEAYEHRAAVKRHLGDSSAADDLARVQQLRERPNRERTWAAIPAAAPVPRPDYSDLARYHQRRAEHTRQRAQIEAAEAAQRSVNQYMQQRAGHLGAMGVRFGW
jgi:tetratricopeptide (TPR) repeat protein